MTTAIPAGWQCNTPSSIVVGDGPYATALALTFGAELLSSDQLLSGPVSHGGNEYPRILEQLELAMLVVSDAMTPSDAMQLHGVVWEWVVKTTSAKDEHDMAFFFVLPPRVPPEFVDALGVGLSVPTMTPDTGHDTWRRSDSLVRLLELVASTARKDRKTLDRRRASDARRAALSQLRQAVQVANKLAVQEAARDVLAVFEHRQYFLELFCRQPRHRHGNLLYSWLEAAVTGSVTPDWIATGRSNLADWLA